MRRVRRMRPPSDLADFTYAELCRLAERGDITWRDVSRITHERVLELNGDTDPYGHLRAKQ